MNLNDLPGAEIILPGLSDLAHGKSNTVGALLVAIAATRLTEAGFDIQKHYLPPEPELTLYAYLQEEREDAYPYYNALLDRLHSFCNALEMTYKTSDPGVYPSFAAFTLNPSPKVGEGL